MARIWAWLEAVSLGLMGGLMAMLSFSATYSQLLNPFFRWITLAAGLIIAILAAAALVSRRRRGQPGRALLFALLLVMAVSVEADLRGRLSQAGPAGALVERGGVIHRQGVDYARTNSAVLFFLAQERSAGPAGGKPMVFRGQVLRTEALDARGNLVVARANVICCMSDAVGLGVVVEGVDPRDFQPWSWVNVFGRLAAAPDGLRPPALPQLDGVFPTQAAPGHVFRAEAVEPTPRPGSPYLFALDDREPHEY